VRRAPRLSPPGSRFCVSGGQPRGGNGHP
jgi:hypothetical protein